MQVQFITNCGFILISLRIAKIRATRSARFALYKSPALKLRKFSKAHLIIAQIIGSTRIDPHVVTIRKMTKLSRFSFQRHVPYHCHTQEFSSSSLEMREIMFVFPIS